MKESDWKVFKEVKDVALDKCCGEALIGAQEIISESAKSNHQRFLDLYDLIINTNDDIAAIFDGHSRSKAALQTMLMRRYGLVSDELVAKFSLEFQENTKPLEYK